MVVVLIYGKNSDRPGEWEGSFMSLFGGCAGGVNHGEIDHAYFPENIFWGSGFFPSIILAGRTEDATCNGERLYWS